MTPLYYDHTDDADLDEAAQQNRTDAMNPENPLLSRSLSIAASGGDDPAATTKAIRLLEELEATSRDLSKIHDAAAGLEGKAEPGVLAILYSWIDTWRSAGATTTTDLTR